MWKNNPDLTKGEMRKEVAEKIKALTPSYIKEASEEIREKVLASEEFKKAETVFIYVAMDREVQTDHLIEEALALGKTVAVPRCTGPGAMEAVVIETLTDLVPATLGIREPKGGRIIPADAIDLALVPSVTCDIQGNRLGHGMGYYDRFLERSRAFRMALCFDTIIAAHVPTDEHDIKMNQVITELRTY